MSEGMEVNESPQSRVSVITPYSYGIVAANKELDTDEIEVVPIEDSPMLNGELTDAGNGVSSKGSSDLGSHYETKANVAVSIRAKWLKLGQGNRKTSPDVRRGAEVLIWRIADQDEYWWTTLGDDSDLRKLETVIYAWSATKEEGAKTDADNSYFLEVSTHKKTITLYTSKANEEPYSYTLQIDTGNGTITLQDDIENYLHLNSAEHLWHCQNTDGSFWQINKKDVNINAVENFNVTAGKNISMNAGKDLNTDAGSNSTFKSGATSTTDATNIIEDASLMTIKANLTTANGKGGSTGSGTLNGSFEVLGSVHARQDLTADGTLKGNQVVSVLNFIGPNV